jgi:hypothetical protein
MNVTFCKCNCHSFALCLPYAKFLSYSTGYVQISNDGKLNMADVAHSLRDPLDVGVATTHVEVAHLIHPSS